jgi:hypothetical protein
VHIWGGCFVYHAVMFISIRQSLATATRMCTHACEQIHAGLVESNVAQEVIPLNVVHLGPLALGAGELRLGAAR